MRLSAIFIASFLLVCLSGLAKAEENLTAYYDFETEEAIDQSGNELHGSVVGGTPELIDGAVGKAWNFSGGLRVEMDYQDFKSIRAELSMRCFILPEETAGHHIIYEEGGAWTGFGVRVMDGMLEFGVVCCGQNHPPPEIISAELPDVDDWIEIAAVFDKGAISLYMDGEKVAEEKTEWAELGAHGQAGGIGEKQSGDTAFNDGSGFFIGGIDELRVYSRALQPSELSAAVSSQGKLATTWGEIKGRY